MKKKYYWIDEDRVFEVFSDSIPCPEAIVEEGDNSPIDFSYHPDAYDEADEDMEENEKMINNLKLPINKEITVDFKVDGDPYTITIKNVNNEFYRGVVIHNARQDMDPGDLCWLKKKYVKLICDKIKEGN